VDAGADPGRRATRCLVPARLLPARAAACGEPGGSGRASRRRYRRLPARARRTWRLPADTHPPLSFSRRTARRRTAPRQRRRSRDRHRACCVTTRSAVTPRRAGHPARRSHARAFPAD
jgi:hypothetical protein